ncbi:MAG: serine/threonine-protein kinase [Planctomycetota bacterium]
MDETREAPRRDGRETPLHQRETASVDVRDAERTTATGPAPPRDSEPMPERIGDYKILRELAQGGMGVVYLAESEELGRRVALKVLRGGNFGSAQARERFQIEARVIARLRHPNIVGIHEIGVDGEREFLVMDLIEGESLRERLERGPLEQRDAARIAQVVAEALSYAHGRAILHRDIKPGNILLPPDGGPVITDFGLAKDGNDLERSPTVTGQAIGTPAYMAPEQARGDWDRVDRRSDVYSLGATLYEMLTGHAPFEGGSVLEVLALVNRRAPRPPGLLREGLDRDLETIVLHCLGKEPERRYATARELAEDLGRYLADESIQARRPSPYDRARRWLRRHRRVAIASGLTLAVALVLAGIEASVFVRRLQRDQELADQAAERIERERDQALEALQRAARAGAAPPRASQLLILAEAEVAGGRPAAALPRYRDAFRLAPGLRATHGIQAALAAAEAAPPGSAEDAALAREAAEWLREAVRVLRPPAGAAGPDDPAARAAIARVLAHPRLARWRARPELAALAE